MKECIIDVFKKGKGREKSIYIEVDGERIGSMHLGDAGSVGDPRRVVINFAPVLWGSGYTIDEFRNFLAGSQIKVTLIQEKKEEEE